MPARLEEGWLVNAAVIAAVALGVAGIVLVVHRLEQVRPLVSIELPARPAPGDAELIRCRDLGMAAADDAACLAAWAENRARFFGTEPASPRPPVDEAANGAVDDNAAGGMAEP